MNDLDPRIARVECWRRMNVGMQSVNRPSEADIVIVSAPGGEPIRFEVPRDHAALGATIAALKAAYGLGRRDVIRQVRDIFEVPRNG